MPAPALLRRTVAGLAATACGLTLAVAGPGQVGSAAALDAPDGLAVDMKGAATPVLSWDREAGLPFYDVQVDDDPGFGSPAYSVNTQNKQFVPNSALPSGTVYWRVRTRAGSTTSSWSTRSSFQVAPVEVPVPTAPAGGAELQQPVEPPLLRWQTSKGATSYTVQVDGDADFIGARSYRSLSTSLVIPDALGAGDWHWRVIAHRGSGIVSTPSDPRTFDILPLTGPDLSYPNDTFDQPVEDVVLDWQPVPGAQTYDLQVATDPDFNNFAYRATNLQGTRYSPPVTLNNDEFWWRVRAVDTAGLPTPWEQGRYNFKREWRDQPQPVFPLGTSSAPGEQGIDTTFFQWTPAQHASMYEVEVARDREFTDGTVNCRTTGTTLVPRFDGGPDDCLALATTDPAQPLVRWWRVRPIDGPYESGDGLPGNFSAPQAFVRTPQPARIGEEPSPEQFSFRRGTGLRVAMTGTGLLQDTQGCASTPSVGYPDSSPYTKPTVCKNMSATPIFSWDRQPDMDYYVVWFAQDENFTTTELQPIVTSNTMLAIDKRERVDVLQLPENQAGRPYYWYVQPCRVRPDNSRRCGPRPDSQAVGVSGAAAFEKASPAITGLHDSDPAGNDITLSWDDYLDINARTASHGETGQQSAHTYRVQVDNEAGFSAPLLDQATVDQTTYTSGSTLYPEGTLYWRVQAIDTQGNPLPWSETESLTKSSSRIVLSSPEPESTVAGTTPLEWRAQAFASRNTVEVYRNGDTSFSSANRVLSVTTPTTAYAPTEPLPASSAAYVWRVRRIDASDNPGPWSQTGRFFSVGAAPELLEPTPGDLQEAYGIFTSWSDVAAAASYRIIFRKDGVNVLERTTTATAYAPSSLGNGDYTWTVTALDSAGQALGTSPAGRFSVDASAPAVTRVKPRRLNARSTLKVVFSEPVSGLSTRTVKLKRGRKAVRVRVKTLDGGTVAVVDPRSRLRRGTHTLVFSTTAITDRAGNGLTTGRRSLSWGR